MKTVEPTLAEFIKDFDLESRKGFVCFEATIQFEAINIFKQLESEVHIVTLENNGVTILYLLHPDIIRHNIPDTLFFTAANFTYHKKLSLEIQGKGNVTGEYTLTILPTTSQCTDPTINEIKAKLYN